MSFNAISNLTFIQFIDKCDYLKGQYQEVLAPFFDKELVRIWKTMIYSLNIKEWQRDKLWEFLNDDITKIELEDFIR